MEEFRESAPGISLVVLDSDRMDCTEVTVWDSCHMCIRALQFAYICCSAAWQPTHRTASSLWTGLTDCSCTNRIVQM